MERKLILNFFYFGLIIIIVVTVLTTITYQNLFRKQIEKDLKINGNVIAEYYNETKSSSGLEKLDSGNIRITLIQKDGKVLFDSVADVTNMENHSDRPEVKKALKEGTASIVRTSDTINAEDYYYAIKLNNGNILRVSMTINSIFSNFSSALPAMFLIGAMLIVVSIIFSVFLTNRLLAPIRKIPAQLDDPYLAENNDEIYKELVPFVKEIQYQRQKEESMRQEFSANVSHELKTPLTTISGYAEIIESGMASNEEDIRKFAGKIKSEANRMTTLVGDIIKLSKLDANDNTALNDDINLKEIADKCSEELQSAASKKGIKIIQKGNSEIFKGNAVEMHEIIYNLVDNAIKYNRINGNVYIYIADKEITVKDTGIGISEKDIPRIFERFYRADKSRSRQSGGTGLGLSIVKHAVVHHHAKISVQSKLNIGTEIKIKF